MTHEVKMAKRYLQQLTISEEQIDAALKHIEELKKSQIYLSGISYDKPAVQTSPSGSSAYEEAVIRLADMEKAAKQKIVDRELLRHTIISQINALNDTQGADLLRRRYLSGKTNDEIADEMYLSPWWIRHKIAEVHAEFYRQNQASIEEFMKKEAVRNERVFRQTS